jgi:hypothetical protein
MASSYVRAVVGGLVGTIAMTLMMMFVAPMMGVHMNIAKNLADMMGAPRVVGMVAHFMLGTLLFPGIFVLLYKMLPGAPIVKEMIWASALWLSLRFWRCL